MQIIGNPNYGYHAMTPTGNLLCGNTDVLYETVTQETGVPTCPQCLEKLGIVSWESNAGYAVQCHDGDGVWMDDGLGPMPTQEHAKQWLAFRVGNCPTWHFRIVERVQTRTDTLIEQYKPD